ncbi:MAG: hypothetical protein LBV30_01070 [Propionibacteriaceae bacterium]|jgi:hypothetical protein|nr:hypothetical protein [Propionibacteriaceae bacterium]
MWLWIDPDDPLQWGSHTTSITVGATSLTATATAQSVTFNGGQADTTVTCSQPFTARPRDSRLREHSPTGCDLTYMIGNNLDDPNDHFQLSGYSTWEIQWSTSDNQSGQFTWQTPTSQGPAIHINQLHTVETNPQGQ